MERTFKKGEKVWVHSRDSRDTDYYGYVKSAGNKYVTVCYTSDCTGPGEKFRVDYGYRTEIGPWEIYHSEDEYNEIKRKNGIISDFIQMAQNRKFTFEEIETFLKIHKEYETK